MTKTSLILIVHNIRSTHNVGSILRSADGFGVKKVYLSGYTPYPTELNDQRLPHVSKRAEQQIAKTALGAEKSVEWIHVDDPLKLIKALKQLNYLIVVLEQTNLSVPLFSYRPSQKIALIVGSEIGGVSNEMRELADAHIEIPMLGNKDSLNVSVATAVALYHVRYFDQENLDKHLK